MGTQMIELFVRNRMAGVVAIGSVVVALAITGFGLYRELFGTYSVVIATSPCQGPNQNQ